MKESFDEISDVSDSTIAGFGGAGLVRPNIAERRERVVNPCPEASAPHADAI